MTINSKIYLYLFMMLVSLVFSCCKEGPSKVIETIDETLETAETVSDVDNLKSIISSEKDIFIYIYFYDESSVDFEEFILDLKKAVKENDSKEILLLIPIDPWYSKNINLLKEYEFEVTL